MPIYRITHEHSRPGGDATVMVLHYSTDAGSPPPETPTAALVAQWAYMAYDEFLTATSPVGGAGALITHMAEGMSFHTTQCQQVTDGPPNIGTYSLTPVNSTSSTSSPPQVAALISKRSGIAGPGARGRTYWGPLASTGTWDMNNNTWVTDFRNALGQRWLSYMNTLTDETDRFGAEVIFQRETATSYLIDQYLVPVKVATQRRRT